MTYESGLPPADARLPALIDKIPLLLFAAVLLFLCVQAPYFLSWQNIAIILRQTAPLAILCFGLVCVIAGGGDDVVAGGIDLSLPAIAVLAVAIVSHGLTNGGDGYLWLTLLALSATLLAGGLNALLVVLVRLPPLLAMLACSVALTGLTNLLTQQRRISVGDPAIVAFRDERLLGLPLAVWFMLLVFSLFQFIVHHSRWGRHLQVVGGSLDTAQLSGLPVRRLVTGSYLLAALAAALSSLTLLAQGSGSSPGTAEPLLLEMVLAALIGGALVGLLNALLIIYCRIKPFLATLGTWFIGSSIERIYTDGGGPIAYRRMAPEYHQLAVGDLWGIPQPILIVSALLIIYYLLFERAIVGKRLHAIGLNTPAALIAGVNVRRSLFWLLIAASVTCAVGGVILSANLRQFTPLAGQAYLMDAIAAVFIGTAFHAHGRPNVPGTLIGVLFLGMIANGLNLMGLNFMLKDALTGIILVVALALSFLQGRLRQRQ